MVWGTGTSMRWMQQTEISRSCRRWSVGYVSLVSCWWICFGTKTLDVWNEPMEENLLIGQVLVASANHHVLEFHSGLLTTLLETKESKRSTKIRLSQPAKNRKTNCRTNQNLPKVAAQHQSVLKLVRVSGCNRASALWAVVHRLKEFGSPLLYGSLVFSMSIFVVPLSYFSLDTTCCGCFLWIWFALEAPAVFMADVYLFSFVQRESILQETKLHFLAWT